MEASLLKKGIVVTIILLFIGAGFLSSLPSLSPSLSKISAEKQKIKTIGGGLTIQEQIEYLRDTVFSSDFDETWTIQQSTYYNSAITGVITNLEINTSKGSPNLATGTLTFKRGTIANL